MASLEACFKAVFTCIPVKFPRSRLMMLHACVRRASLSVEHWKEECGGGVGQRSKSSLSIIVTARYVGRGA